MSRILITAGDCNRQVSGIGLYAAEIARRLAGLLVARGHAVSVALRDDVEAVIAGVRAAGAGVVPLGPSEGPALGRLVDYYIRASRAAGGFDAVYSLDHKIPFWMAPWSRLALTVHDCCHLRVAGEFGPGRRAFYYLTQRIGCRAATRVATVSAHAGADIERYYPGAAGKVRVVPNGCDLGRFSPVPGPDDAAVLERHGLEPGYFLYVGRISPRKNVGLMLRAIRRLVADARAPRLVLAGSAGWRSGDVEAALTNPALARLVRQTGYIDAADLPALYRQAAALLYPSCCEGFGLPVLEALASGRPAAVARGTATQEVGGDLVHAVEPLDDAALAGFMAAVMDGSLARPAPAAVAAHLARFDWDTAAEAAAALVEEMLASQHAGRDHRANSVG